jgi:hypothetical protein
LAGPGVVVAAASQMGCSVVLNLDWRYVTEDVRTGDDANGTLRGLWMKASLVRSAPKLLRFIAPLGF